MISPTPKFRPPPVYNEVCLIWQLPDELLLKIFSSLNADLQSAMDVCKRWQQCAVDLRSASHLKAISLFVSELYRHVINPSVKAQLGDFIAKRSSFLPATLHFFATSEASYKRALIKILAELTNEELLVLKQTFKVSDYLPIVEAAAYFHVDPLPLCRAGLIEYALEKTLALPIAQKERDKVLEFVYNSAVVNDRYMTAATIFIHMSTFSDSYKLFLIGKLVSRLIQQGQLEKALVYLEMLPEGDIGHACWREFIIKFSTSHNFVEIADKISSLRARDMACEALSAQYLTQQDALKLAGKCSTQRACAKVIVNYMKDRLFYDCKTFISALKKLGLINVDHTFLNSTSKVIVSSLRPGTYEVMFALYPIEDYPWLIRVSFNYMINIEDIRGVFPIYSERFLLSLKEKWAISQKKTGPDFLRPAANSFLYDRRYLRRLQLDLLYLWCMNEIMKEGIKPSEPFCYFKMLVRFGFLDEAEELLVCFEPTQKEKALSELASKYIDLMQLEHAEALCENVCSVDVLQELMLAYVKANQFDKAEELAMSLEATQKEKVLIVLAYEYIKLIQLERARALNEIIGNEDVLQELLFAYHATNQFDLARIVYQDSPHSEHMSLTDFMYETDEDISTESLSE